MPSETKGAQSQVATDRFRRIDRGDSAPVYVTPSGAEFVRASDLLRSKVGRSVVKSLAGLELKKSKSK
jgi:hypothetical protein